MEPNNDDQANLIKYLTEIYKEIKVKNIYVDYTFSFWVDDGWNLLTKEDSKLYNNEYYFADLNEMMNLKSDQNSFMDLSEDSSIKDLNNLFHIDKSNLELLNETIKNVRYTNKPLAWWERTIKWVENNKTNTVLVKKRGRDMKFPGEMKILGYVLASRKNDIYLGASKNEVIRLILEPFSGKFVYGEHGKPLGLLKTELDFRLIMSLSIWKSKSAKEVPWNKNMVTVSLMFMFPSEEPLDGKDLANMLEGAIKTSRIDLVNDNNPFVHKKEFETFDDLLIEIYKGVVKTNEKSDEYQRIKDKVRKTALEGLTLGTFSSNNNIIHIPDFRSKSVIELINYYPQIIHLLGRLAWSTRHDVFLGKIVTEKNDEEIIMDLKDKQVSYWRTDFISFINKYAKLLISTSNIEKDCFPLGSYTWAFANTILAVENISLQLSMIHEYNNFIEQNISYHGVEKTLELRIQQIKDMEEYYNLDTSDSQFHDIVRALQKSFDIERGFEIIRSKIQETSTVNISYAQNSTSNSIRLLNKFLIPLTFIVFLANFLSLIYDIGYLRNVLLILAIGTTTVILGFAIVISSLINTRNSIEMER